MNSNKMQLKDDSTLITGTGKELLQKCMDIRVGRQTISSRKIYLDCRSFEGWYLNKAEEILYYEFIEWMNVKPHASYTILVTSSPLNNKEAGTEKKTHKFKLVLDECIKIRFCVKSQLVVHPCMVSILLINYSNGE